MAKGKPASKKASLKSMKIVDGKQHEAAEVNINIRSIDEIMGVNTSTPFKARSTSEFESQVADMNLADMQALATRVGLLPVHDRTVLKKRLLDEFRKDLAKRMPYDMSAGVRPSQGLNEDMAAKAKKILNEGR